MLVKSSSTQGHTNNMQQQRLIPGEFPPPPPSTPPPWGEKEEEGKRNIPSSLPFSPDMQEPTTTYHSALMRRRRENESGEKGMGLAQIGDTTTLKHIIFLKGLRYVCVLPHFLSKYC